MKQYLEFDALTYDGIGDYIEKAARQDETAVLYLLGKAAAYVDIAYALEMLPKARARELHTCIAVYAACNTL